MRLLLAAVFAAGSLLAQSLIVSPASPTVTTGGTLQLTAAVTGTTSQVNWAVAGVAGGNSIYGTIQTTGVNTATYTAPAIPPGQSTFRLSASTADGVAEGKTTITVVAGSAPRYTVMYVGNGATSGAAPVDGSEYGTGSPVTVLGNSGNLAEPGYSFAGWNSAANGSGTSYSPGSMFLMGSASVTLYAQWQAAATYSMTYSGNGATSGAAPVDGNRYSAGASVTVLGNTGNLAESGASFAGWNTAANGSGMSLAPGAILAMGSANVTLYAQWQAAATYSVTYSANGATSGGAPVDSNRYNPGASATVLGNSGNLAESGASFAGWNTAANGSGMSYAPGAILVMGSANVTLYAQWQAAATYSVTYSANGATGGMTPVDNNKYGAGALAPVMSAGTLTKTGYTFAGWNTSLVGSGVTYAAGSTLIMPSGGVTLYAQWSSTSGGYSIQYLGNGSTFGLGPPDPTQYAAGQQVTVYGNIGYLFKPGYSFAGWNTAADGSAAFYPAGAALSMPSGGIALYAQWSTANVPVSIWGGAEAAMALKADGTVWTWGFNNDGQLGNGQTGPNSDVPVQVVGPNGVGYLTGITAIMSGEEHKFALRNDGTVWAWGMNEFDQLGDGNATQSATPVQVSLLHNVTKLGGRAYHSLAVQADGSVWAWGWDARGALGIGVADSNSDYPVPVQVQGVTNPIMVSSGYCFSLALLQDHTVVAWGQNKAGELGNGTTVESDTAVPVQGLTSVVWISAGWGQAIAIKADGTVWTWGSNTWSGSYPGSGLLGDGTTANHLTPEQVPGLSGAIQASAGDSHTLVLLRDGTVWGFGSNSAGQLGTGAFTTQSLVPVQVQGLSNVVNITARDWHSQAIRADGTVWSWGSGESGELGNGTMQNSAVPVLVRIF